MSPTAAMRNTAALMLLFATTTLQASPWIYRGSLKDSGQDANGRYDLRLSVLDAQNNAVVVGPLYLYAVEVRHGRFETEVDFGADFAATANMQLRTEVSIAGAAFESVGPAQAIIPSGTPGTCWDTHGNAGTNGTTDALGTLDDQPLKFVVNDLVVGHLEGSADGYNVLLGSPLNTHSANSAASLILGGGHNAQEGNRSLNANAAILGGLSNYAGLLGTVAGGAGNYAGEFGYASGTQNCAGGSFSYAMGHRAKVRVPQGADVGLWGPGCVGVPQAADANGDNGSFIWSDDQSSDFVTSGERQFLVRAGGGLLFNSTTFVDPDDDVQLKTRGSVVNDDMDLRLVTANSKSALLRLVASTGALKISAPNLTGPDYIAVANGASLSSGGTWTNASSRSLKQGFAAIDARDVLDKVLALPISTWRYRSSDEGTHIGPVAEDFHASFGLGNSDRSISTVDADGVALAAIQGLYQVMAAERQRLHDDNAWLRKQNADLQQRVSAIESRQPDRP